ncbi:MAG: outer membrane lipoprotein carrier protein LolA [Thermodesulfobacteriota bacterium]|jgi:outer membrane lipoprotein carrier protein
MKIWLLILVSLLWIPLTAKGAAPISADEVVKRLREIQEKTKDFSADIHQEKKLSLLKEKIISRGKIRFKKPDKVSIEFFHPESSQMVFDGKTALLYYKEEKLAERYSLRSNPIAERYLLFSKDPFQEKLAEWKILEDRESFLVMEIIPKVKDPLFVKTRLRVSKKDWMLIGMDMVEKNGDTTSIRYSNMKVNTGLTESDFEIHLPKDVKITDVK